MERPCRRDDLVTRELDDELLVYDPVSDESVLLNASAAAIVVLCDGTRTVPESVDGVHTRVPDAGPTVPEEVRDVIDQLSKTGLIVSEKRIP